MQEFNFPNWVNRFTFIAILGGLATAGYLATCLFAGIHPTIVNVGYSPKQPVPYSHTLHAGKLKIDCRYCHTTVEQAGHAAIPPTATCGNCHGGERTKAGATLGIIHPDNPLLQPVRDSLETKEPVEWQRVHNLPDFVYFNHSVHIARGVSCVSCHGRIDKMEVVTQVEPLSMKWCIDCHRNPESHIRDPKLVTQLDFKPLDSDGNEIDFESYGSEWKERLKIQPNISCSTCHR
jgi:hypothetical protein